MICLVLGVRFSTDLIKFVWISPTAMYKLACRSLGSIDFQILASMAAEMA